MKILNLCVNSMVSVAVLATFCGAEAATGRSSMMPTETARMPSMPVVSLNTIGNPAVTTISQPTEVVNAGHSITPTPTPTPEPTPVVECPDGGIKNSKYTITMCMNDVLQCINTGALQGGLNDMFNEDVRNAVMGGMKLCQASVDKCISEVRVDCRNVYNESNDVWLDFNSRIIQPEYYNFVLRKTGLTPNQAENTCLLLDRNTYGSSFAAVSDTNKVNTEYNNKVGAYNESMNGTLSKDNPQGVAVNTVGYDGNRGHYARWDAAKAECLIRVAAYNKDKLITNSWLFGAVGNDNPAEVWEKAGSTFTCNKELFDFNSLLNDTKTAAVIAVPGGAVLGTAIGAAAGAGAYNKKQEACDDPKYAEKMGDYIRRVMHQDQLVSNYIGENINFDNFGSVECEKVLDLYSKVKMYEHAIDYCENRLTAQEREQIVSELKIGGKFICNEQEIASRNLQLTNKEKTIVYINNCSFKALDKVLVKGGEDSPLCEGTGACVDDKTIKGDLRDIQSFLSQLDKGVGINVKLDKGKEIGKGAAIGLATGAAAGGIATAITAFVEKSNITCKVGDGLNSVALGKAHTIDSLKDFYVKWNLHLPDAVSPTSAVVDKASWEQACSQFNSKLMDCPKVQINLKDKSGKYTLVPSACKVSGTICIVNDSVMTSNGIK